MQSTSMAGILDNNHRWREIRGLPQHVAQQMLGVDILDHLDATDREPVFHLLNRLSLLGGPAEAVIRVQKAPWRVYFLRLTPSVVVVIGALLASASGDSRSSPPAGGTG